MRTRLSTLFDSFQYRDYRWLWMVVALTNTGKWAFTLGVTAQVYALTDSSFWSGAIMFASMVPSIVGSPLLGVLADRLERRRMIFMAIALVLIVLMTLTFTTIGNVLAPTGITVLAFMFGLSTSTLGVSINAMIPAMVPKSSLYNAYSLSAVGQRGTEFIGPFVAAPLLAMLGPQAVYVLAIVLYAATTGFVMLLSVPEEIRDEQSERTFLQSLTEGFHYIRSHSQIARLIVLVGLHCALTMAFLGMLPGFVQHDLGSQSAFYGMLMSMVGLGAIMGTLFLAGVQSHQLRTKLFWWSAVLSGLSLVFLGVSRTNLTAILSIILVGGSQALFMTLTIAVIQEDTEEYVRGRVTSVYFVMAAGLMSLANWVYGALGTVIAPRYIMLITGTIFIAVVVVYWGITVRADKRANRASFGVPGITEKP